MGDEGDRPEYLHDDALSVDDVARLDAFLDGLGDEQRSNSPGLTASEMADRILAAQLSTVREGAEEPAPAFLAELERRVAQAAVSEAPRHRRSPVSRGGFLRAAAALAGGAGLGVAAVEGVTVVKDAQRPHTLIVAGNERWYDIAAVGDVAPGGIKRFSAGGVLGYLFNTDGELHAVSAICTHMGCRLKPDSSATGAISAGELPGLHCLCHGSRFNRRGAVVHGLAPSPLPEIALRIEHGRVHALGTAEDI